MDVADAGDMNILFMKFNRKGRFIAVQPKLTWKIDTFIFYASGKHGDWIVTEFDSFFKNNAELVKLYSGIPSDTTSNNTITLETT
jgi:hypothetical protein